MYAEERQRPQTLTADLRLWLDLTEAATTGALARTCDYGALSTQVTFILNESRFKLLESAALCLVRLALLPMAVGEARTVPAAARASLSKPHVLSQPAVPTVTMERRAAELVFSNINPQITEVFSCPEARILRFSQPAKPADKAILGKDHSILAVTPGLWLAVSRLG